MKIAEMKQAVETVLKAGLVPMLTGSPGTGKSDITRGIADKFELLVIDMRLSQTDPTDLMGFPIHNGERMEYAPPKDIPLQGFDKPPAGYKGWLLFLDEFVSAPMAVQAAAYKLVQDRMVGQHNIHKKCVIVCAGNKADDGGIVNRLSTPMQSRLIHLELDVDIASWVSWATENNLDHRVISYLESHPDHLHKFDPNHNDKTFACPRTWEFTAKLLKGNDEPNLVMKDILIGTLSAGVAHEFYAYLHYCSELPKIGDIIKRPDDIEIPDEPALLYAISHMTAAYMDENNADRLMRFVDRLPLDFGVTCMRSVLKRRNNLLQIEAVRNWAHKVADEVF